MRKISDLVVKKPKLIVIVSLLLLIPSLVGYLFTNVNYDILSYLPSRLDSVKGEQILEEDFNAGTMTIVLFKMTDDNGGKISPNTVIKFKNQISKSKMFPLLSGRTILLIQVFPVIFCPTIYKMFFTAVTANTR